MDMKLGEDQLEQTVGDCQDAEQGGAADAATIERVYRYVSPCVDAEKDRLYHLFIKSRRPPPLLHLWKVSSVTGRKV